MRRGDLPGRLRRITRLRRRHLPFLQGRGWHVLVTVCALMLAFTGLAAGLFAMTVSQERGELSYGAMGVVFLSGAGVVALIRELLKP